MMCSVMINLFRWAFPIPEKSRHGLMYSLTPEATKRLKSNEAFMQQYRTGIEYALFAWGWDVANFRPVSNPAPDQTWQGWAVRLYKIGRKFL